MTLDEKVVLQEVIDRILYCTEYIDKLKEFNQQFEVKNAKIAIKENEGIYKQTNIENNGNSI